MTREEEQLLLVDLCARLPYGVIVQVNDGLKGTYNSQLVQVFCDRVSCSVSVRNPLIECICIDSVKPYLRPISSMTKEEEDELCELCTISDCNVDAEWEFCGVGVIQSHSRYGTYFSTDYSAIDLLNKKMFDFRGLIPKGIAISTEVFNPYKD